MPFVLEPARLEDAAVAASLIAQTDRELFRYCTGGSLDDWIELSIHEWRHPRGIYSHTLADIVRAGPDIQGLIVSYSTKRHNEIDWTFGSSAPHVSEDLRNRVRETHRTVPFLFPTLPENVWYVQNIAVVPEAQGKNLGRFLMEQIFQRARLQGCKACHLDVDSSTPAVHFYRRLGMEVLVETRVPAIASVATHFRMVKSLEK